ncbi:hypothetical protein Trydic_g13670 [Trypoxylus dichotomus]
MRLSAKMGNSTGAAVAEQYNFIKTYIHEAAGEVLGQTGGSKCRQAWNTLRTLKENTRDVKAIDPIGMESWKRYYESLMILGKSITQMNPSTKS